MTDYSNFRYVRVEVQDAIAEITLDRPDSLNACDRDGHKELSLVLRAIANDDSVLVAVVMGAGRAFSVGGDLDMIEALNRNPDTLYPVMSEAREIVQSHIDFEKPIVAAIHGPAMGVGATFALLCDFVVMEQDVRIADGHIRAALSAGDGGVLAWPLSMGLIKAKKYLMTGDWVTAEDAERLGLVSEVVERGMAIPRALAIARRLADGPQVAIRATKVALNQWLRLGQTAFDYSLAMEMISAAHSDVPRALAGLRTSRIGAIEPEEKS